MCQLLLQISMISLYKIINISLLVTIILAAKLKSPGTIEAQVPKSDNQKHVVESNHYYSDKQLQTSYNIDKVKTELALIVILRPRQDHKPYQSAIQFKLDSDSSTVTCQMKSQQSLCVLDKVPNPRVKLGIKCDKLPCEAAWTIYQAKPQQPKAMQEFSDLFIMKQSQQHTIIVATCNSPQHIKDLAENLKMFSNNQFTNATNQGSIYFLFKKQQKGFMYFRSTKDIKGCLKIGVYTAPASMTPSADIRDFVVSDQSSVFNIEKPSSIFRIDCSMHELLKKNPVKSAIQIRLTGKKDGIRSVIQQSKITPLGIKTTYDFSYVFNPIEGQWSQIQIQFRSADQMIMLNVQLSLSEIPEVEKGQITYFSLKKSMKITYKLIGQADAKDGENIKMLSSDKLGLKLSQSICSAKNGCQFTVQALKDVNIGSIYFSANVQQTKQQEQIVTFDIDKQVTKKVKEGDTMYFKKTIEAGKSIQVVVNSPNVIIWAANIKKCQNPNKQCHEKVGNNQHPFVYEAVEKIDLILSVLGLDTCEFTMTIIDQNDNYVNLADSVAFSYEMDDQESEIIFKFKMQEKHDVSFNLIAPLHSLNLFVSNSDKKPNTEETDLQSVDGYLFLSKKEIQSNTFTILVQKTKAHQKQYVHFSIIASTTNSNMRLQPTVTQYQSLKSKGSRQYVFQFQTDKQYILNFYTHNAIGQELNINLKVSNKDDDWISSEVVEFQIDADADSLNLKDVSEKLCQKSASTTCEVFLKITNTLERQIDLSLTLLVEDSVIQLKDGLWQSFPINSLSSNAHFYYFPRHANKSVNIVYKSTFTDLRIAYSVWKAEDKTIDPTEWAFPTDQATVNTQNKNTPPLSYFDYRPTKHIQLSADSLKNCWPSCVVLISVLTKKEYENMQQKAFNLKFSDDKFYILASNNIVEIPEKTKLDVVMKTDEQKFFLLDMKSAKEKDTITVFTSVTIGYVDFYGSVYSQSNPRCPTEQESDFIFGRIQTQIEKKTFKRFFKENEMQDDRDVYICLLAKAAQESKFYVEWTSDQQIIKVLDLDSFETVPIEKESKKIYQVTPRYQEYQIKFTRTRGFPYLKVLVCKGQDDYEKCLQKDDDKTEKKQMVTKTEVFNQPACDSCIVFIEITTQESAELEIHVQSKYSEVELKENRMVSDFIEKEQENRYLIIAVAQQETIININIQQGKIEAELTDLNQINIKKDKPTNGNMIHIVVPAEKSGAPKDVTKDGSSVVDAALMGLLLGKTYFNQNYQGSTMRYLHLTIKSTDKQQSASYSVTYSSGDRQVYLQDGLVTDYTLQAKKQTIFYYDNVLNKNHIMLSISMQDSKALYNVKMVMSYFTDPTDEDTKEDFTPDKPPMRKGTPQPTIVFSLPQDKRLFSFSFTNPSDKDQKISLVINHMEVMLLPYQHVFPFELHQKQMINMLVDIVNPGYLVIEIKKCDQSNPQFAYTFSQEQFQKEQYTYSTVLSDDPSFAFNVKANEVGTLYLMFKSPDDQASVLSIQVTHSNEKVTSKKVKAGNKGILQYQLLNSEEAEITFTGAVCSGQKCPGQVTYYTVSATNMSTLYSQSVCPKSYFNTESMVSQKPLNITKIEAKPDSNNQIKFKYRLLDQISYISVKGYYDNKQIGGQVFYKPMQVVTVWGQLSRTSHSHKFGMLMIGLCGFCAVLICLRRCMRPKGYQQLKEDD